MEARTQLRGLPQVGPLSRELVSFKFPNGVH